MMMWNTLEHQREHMSARFLLKAGTVVFGLSLSFTAAVMIMLSGIVPDVKILDAVCVAQAVLSALGAVLFYRARMAEFDRLTTLFEALTEASCTLAAAYPPDIMYGVVRQMYMINSRKEVLYASIDSLDGRRQATLNLWVGVVLSSIRHNEGREGNSTRTGWFANMCAVCRPASLAATYSKE